MNSRTVEHAAIRQREPGSVPRAHNAVADQLSFRERRSEMGAGGPKDEDLVSAAVQQDWHAVMLGVG